MSKHPGGQSPCPEEFAHKNTARSMQLFGPDPDKPPTNCSLYIGVHPNCPVLSSGGQRCAHGSCPEGHAGPLLLWGHQWVSRVGRPAELAERLGRRSRKDTELPRHLFLPESLVAKGSSPQCHVFSPQAIFHWVVMQRTQREKGEGGGREKGKSKEA